MHVYLYFTINKDGDGKIDSDRGFFSNYLWRIPGRVQKLFEEVRCMEESGRDYRLRRWVTFLQCLICETSFEDRLLAAVEKQSTSTPVPVPAPTENEHFFKCLIPALERLPLQKQQQVKFEIYRLVYVAGQEVEAAPWTAFKKNNACSINKLKIIKPVSFYHLLTIITSNCFITLIVLRVIYPFRRIYVQILRKL